MSTQRPHGSQQDENKDGFPAIGNPRQWQPLCGGRPDIPPGFEFSRGEDGSSLVAVKDTERPAQCGWVSPRLRLQPGRYHRLSLRCRTTGYGFWEVQFFSGREPIDFYSSGLPDTCGTWRQLEWYFYGKYDRGPCQTIIWPGEQGRFEVRDLQMREADDAEAWRWFRDILRGLPEVPEEGDSQPGQFLPRTRSKLQASDPEGPVDIATYGDSVGFDVGNLPLDLALESGYPGSRVRLHTRGKGSGGWEELGTPQMLGERVIDLQPDLLVCLGVSTAPDRIAPTLEPLIDRVRAAGETEILLLTNHRGAGPDPEPDRGEEHWDACAEAIRDVARRRQCELVDFRAVIKQMLAAARPPADRLRWYMRDTSCHLNDRGRAVALTLMARHLGVQNVQDVER